MPNIIATSSPHAQYYSPFFAVKESHLHFLLSPHIHGWSTSSLPSLALPYPYWVQPLFGCVNRFCHSKITLSSLPCPWVYIHYHLEREIRMHARIYSLSAHFFWSDDLYHFPIQILSITLAMVTHTHTHSQPRKISTQTSCCTNFYGN